MIFWSHFTAFAFGEMDMVLKDNQIN